MRIEDSAVLIADIGGTNARFAFATPEQPYFVEAQTFQVVDFEKIEDAVEAYLATHQFPLCQNNGIQLRSAAIHLRNTFFITRF